MNLLPEENNKAHIRVETWLKMTGCPDKIVILESSSCASPEHQCACTEKKKHTDAKIET